MTATHDPARLMLVLVALIVATRLIGTLAQRVGQPAVLGELLAGVLLGGSVLGILNPADPVIAALSELGVVVLLFEIGLHTDVASLVRVGGAATMVAMVGVTLPFAFGYLVAHALGESTVVSIVCGASLTATSVGISARVLSDLGQLETREGQVVLGAAVLDDVVGLIILAVVSSIVAGKEVSTLGVARLSAIAIGFVVLAVLLGGLLVPPIMRAVERMRREGGLGLMALAFAFLLAWLAARVGSAMLIGAFAAGLVLHRTPQRGEMERAVSTLGHFFVPFFFAAMGAELELSTFTDGRALGVGVALIAVGVLGKVVAGYAPWWFHGRKTLIGLSMVPRGEVGLIFAQMGLSSGVLGPHLFSAIMLMVMVTTFLAPPLVRGQARRPALPSAGDQPGDGGIDDLVVGTRRSEE